MPAAYIFLEVSLLMTFLVLGYHVVDFKRLGSKRTLKCIGGIFILWVLVDLAAVQLGIWYFPAGGGTLPWRVLSLPIEEYFLFLLHSFACLVLSEVFSRRDDDG